MLPVITSFKDETNELHICVCEYHFQGGDSVRVEGVHHAHPFPMVKASSLFDASIHIGEIVFTIVNISSTYDKTT